MNISSIARTAIVAVSLAAGGMVAAPAQAQSGSPNFSFDFSIGNGFRDYDDDFRPSRRCLSDDRIVRLVRSEGFRNVDFRGGRGEFVRLRATQGNWVYEITVDRCPGRIVDTDRIRRR